MPAPMPGPPGAGDAGAAPPVAVPPDPPPAGPPPGPVPPAKPLNALELARGVVRERLVAVWKRLGRWLRSRSRRSS
jgi:hypothetical protein